MAVIRRIHHLSDADGVEDVWQNGFLRLAGKSNLGAFYYFGWLAFQKRPLRTQLVKVLVHALGPKRHPTARAFHESDFKFGITIEDAFADQVHERDHQLEWKRGHVHIAVFLHALAAGAHHSPDAVLPIVLRLRMDRQRHANLLCGGVNGIEHTVPQIDAINVRRQHGRDDGAL